MSEEAKKKLPKGAMRKTIMLLLGTLWKKKKSSLILTVLMLLVNSSLSVILVLFPKFIIDELVLFVGDGNAELHMPVLLFWAAMTVGLSCANSLFNTIYSLIIDYFYDYFDTYFQQLVAAHAINLDFQYTEDPEALEQMNKAKEGLGWYSGNAIGILNSLYDIVRNFIIAAGIITIIAVGCPILLVVQGVSLVLISLLNNRNNKIELSQMLAMSKVNRVFGYYFFQLGNLCYGKDIRTYGASDMMGDKCEKTNEEITKRWKENAYAKLPANQGMAAINTLRDTITYFYIGFLAITKAITLGDLSMYVGAASSLYWAINSVIHQMQIVVKKCSYAYEYVKFVEYPEVLPKGNKIPKKGEHIIEFKNVSFKYPRSEKWVLHNLSLTIKSGEHLSIVGLNGAGKTTFIKLLCRLYDVNEGEILLDGINIMEYSEAEYRDVFAVVFQDFQLFAFSVKENIALQKTEQTPDEEIEKVLKITGLYDDVMKLPKNMDTSINKEFDEDGSELSGGQRQKVAISRALFKDSPVVILDEPTAALDPIAEYEIYRHFDTLIGGKTAIYISHRLSSCKFCDKIAVFADDTVKEYGTHDELVNVAGGIYAEMFTAQAQYYND